MHYDLLNVLDRKLHSVLREADSRAEQSIRSVFEAIGPDPRSPFVSQVMGPIREACSQGYLERGVVALKVIKETLAPYKAKLKAKDGDQVIQVVEKHFPPDKYVELVGQTPSVFERRQAPARKFTQNDFDLQFALVKAAAHSMSNRTKCEIKLYLDESILHAKASSTPLWKVVLFSVWRGLAQPIIKWIAGVLATVVVAYFIWYFGLK